MQYRVKAVDGARAVVQLALQAESAQAASELAQRQGLRVLAVAPLRRLRLAPTLTGRGEFPLVLFSQELATLIQAGLPLIAALESLAEKEQDPSNRKHLDAVIRLLYEGKSFSAALAHFPAIFPELYVALIQSSEKTGAVSSGLLRYVAYQARIDLLTQKIISASVYPALLFVVGTGVLLFLVGYVVPRFSAVLGDLGPRLPWLSRCLMDIGSWMHGHMAAVCLALAAAVGGAIGLCQLAVVRRMIGAVVVALPGVRDRVFLYQVTRLYRSLGILMQSGIPALTALGMARGLLGARMAASLDQAAQRVREGLPLSRAFEAHQLSTPVALRMLRAGEQSGNLGAMLERTADFHDEEMGRWIDWFVRLFEPLLMVFVGAAIGIVVILMYIPIFELAGSIR
ncbi:MULTISPECIES: type II secretion system F family protein [Ramlibacter]|uniref:Type II secretion system F family protein n=1 Tax=Ramlibacter pinisoli TaxID=2682844 RepID=A0A6N8IY95_9BURK|nr:MULTISPECIES: type II secretion system F family protein [Ramlibacter]MBA2961855.1 type II secretion system F family protein [Ramlibacter sp. CGMCC 1.13660]MVQ31797.1 type II secretion system F family protein [Ramlibacter pinisoli]